MLLFVWEHQGWLSQARFSLLVSLSALLGKSGPHSHPSGSSISRRKCMHVTASCTPPPVCPQVSGVHSAHSLQPEVSVGAPARGPRSPSSAPGREFLAGWRAGTNRRKATRRILVGKPGGRRPKASRSTFPLGPSRKEAPLPGTWRPETGLRTEAPGSSAPSPSRPPLACCSSPFTRFSLSVLVVFHSLCVLGDGKPPPLPPPQPAEVTPPPRQCLRRELVPPCQTVGRERTCSSRQPVPVLFLRAQPFQGPGSGAWNPCCSLRGQRRVRLKELAKLAPLPPLLGEEQEYPVGSLLPRRDT